MNAILFILFITTISYYVPTEFKFNYKDHMKLVKPQLKDIYNKLPYFDNFYFIGYLKDSLVKVGYDEFFIYQKYSIFQYDTSKYIDSYSTDTYFIWSNNSHSMILKINPIYFFEPIEINILSSKNYKHFNNLKYRSTEKCNVPFDHTYIELEDDEYLFCYYNKDYKKNFYFTNSMYGFIKHSPKYLALRNDYIKMIEKTILLYNFQDSTLHNRNERMDFSIIPVK